jgi:hypothetical protein
VPIRTEYERSARSDSALPIAVLRLAFRTRTLLTAARLLLALLLLTTMLLVLPALLARLLVRWLILILLCHGPLQ